MKAELQKIISMKNFFSIRDSATDIIKYSLKMPGILLVQNVHVQWLQSVWLKTDKHFPVFINKEDDRIKNRLPFGIINTQGSNYDENKVIEHDLNKYVPENKTTLKFRMFVPENEIMQNYMHWQRCRKFWWSSVTSTPSLFSISDIKYKDKCANADIVAELPWGQQAVEEVSIRTVDSIPSARAVECTTTLETALLTLLSDARISSTKEEYLRIQRTVAPFKMSFALQFDDIKAKDMLYELALLLNSKLASRNISTWFPEFVLPFEEQLRENRRLGVVYTAILSEKTLSNGIFHLMNSSSMLKEQTHLADFEPYAALLCGTGNLKTNVK